LYPYVPLPNPLEGKRADPAESTDHSVKIKINMNTVY